MGVVTLEDLRIHNPALYERVVAEGIHEGTMRERRRLSCILDMASAGQITETERKALFAVDVSLIEIPTLLEKVRSIGGREDIDNRATLDEQVKDVLARIRNVDSPAPESDPEVLKILDKVPAVE